MKTAYKTNRKGSGNTIKYLSYTCHPFYKDILMQKDMLKLTVRQKFQHKLSFYTKLQLIIRRKEYDMQC